MPNALIKMKLFLLLLLGVLFIQGCATGPAGRPAPSEAVMLQKAQKAENRGNLIEAAEEYSKLAALTSALKRPEYQLRAAAVLLRGNYIAETKQILTAIEDNKLHANQRIRHHLLTAKIALAENKPAAALKALKVETSDNTPADLAAELHLLRADAYLRSGNLIEAVRERVMREPFLLDLNQIPDNQKIIWQTLMLISEHALQQLRIDPPPDELSGWLELAGIAKASQAQPFNIDQMVADWRLRYPRHHVSQEIIDSLLARKLEEIRRPNTIALILPLTGPYEKPAAALRDGFLAAYYGRKNQTYNPMVHIYDAGTNISDIKNIYAQAVNEGAEFIVGPLNKETVNNLTASTRITVPTLTLNYNESPGKMMDNLYQFGLAPEDESRQLAERAWLDGHNEALAILPEGEWGQRVFQAFSENWQQLGGTVLEQQLYPSEQNDFSAQIRTILNLDESEGRHESLEKLLHEKLKFEPRRRQDVDFIFMAAFPRQARLIRPQLKFHYAGNIPVYATSHIFTGKRNQHTDRDMDDVIFGDMPWVFYTSGTAPSLQQNINRQWPEESAQFTRFFALGIDAYNLIPHLNHLKTYPYERYNGETGILSLDGHNRIFRQISWARFKNGIPRPL